MLYSDRLLRERLVAELVTSEGFAEHYERAAGIMLFPAATVERRDGVSVARSSNVLVIGSDEPSSDGDPAALAGFWDLGDPALRPERAPGPGEIILNRVLADALGVQVGDTVALRLPRPEGIPADSPLGERTDRIHSMPRLEVIEIVAARGLGRFSLTASQVPPRNAYVSLRFLQEALQQGERINGILVAGGDLDRPPDTAAGEALVMALRPTLDDLGLTLRRPRLVFTDPSAHGARRVRLLQHQQRPHDPASGG